MGNWIGELDNLAQELVDVRSSFALMLDNLCGILDNYFGQLNWQVHVRDSFS
jgi:hypothetical protein